MAEEKTKKEEEEEQELVPVGEGVDEDATKRGDDEDEEEKKKKKEEEDDDGGDEEEDEDEDRLGASEEEEEDEDGKPKRKRKTRHQRQKEARERDQKELNFQRRYIEKLSGKIEELEGRMGHGEMSQIDTKITDVKSKIKLADQVITKAVNASDGEAMVEAQSIRDELRDELTQLNGAKNYFNRQQQADREAVDPTLVRNASQWMNKHQWWDPSGGDEDSRQVSRIDAALTNEGFDPLSPEYWDELTDRVREALPHRYGNGEDLDEGGDRKKKKKKGGGPSFRTGGRERPLKKNEVYISPERKEAMIEAGVWDDPKERQRYLRSYAEYDRQHANENRA